MKKIHEKRYFIQFFDKKIDFLSKFELEMNIKKASLVFPGNVLVPVPVWYPCQLVDRPLCI